MIAIQTIQKDSELVIKRLKTKSFGDFTDIINKVLALDIQWRERVGKLEAMRADMNRIAKQVGIEMGKGNTDAAEIAKSQTAALKVSIAEFEKETNSLEQSIQEILAQLPNIPHESVPVGNSPEDNTIVSLHNVDYPNLPANPLPHWEIAKNLKLIDFETGAKVSGAGFPFYTGKGARLQRALINFFLDEAIKAGYLEVQAPILVNADSAFGTGQLPDKDGQMYYAPADDLYLIPTAEVPVTNMYRNEIIDELKLPIQLCGYTPCFRREAGSYGKDVRGLNRLHQFDKVEIVQIVHPESSYDVLEQMLEHVKGLLLKLELSHRVLLLCSGDMGFASAKTYDFEVKSLAQDRWLEVSSVSNFEAFQATRMMTRIRLLSQKKPVIAHTLNGSALALPRIVAALLENHQLADGRVKIPQALVPYTGFDYLTP